MQQSAAASHDDVAQAAAATCSSGCARTAPRVHCITNAVAQNFTANVLLAAGCVPSMTLSAEEIGRFVAGARRAAGQSRHLRPRAPRRRPTIAVAAAATHKSALGARSGVRRPQRRRAPTSRASSSARGPTVVRLNHAEFAALAGGEPSREAARLLRARNGIVVALSGATDLVTDGARIASHRQRPCADGQGHRHGLRRLGADRGLLWRSSRTRCARPRPRCCIIGVAGEIAADKRKAPAVSRSRSSMRSIISTAPTLHRARKGDMNDGRSPLYALLDPAVAGGRTLADLAGRIAGQRDAGAIARQARLDARDGRGSARIAGGA